MRRPLCFIVLVLVVGVGRAQTQTPFSAASFDAATAQAAKEKKIVLVDFFTTWCAPCKAMDKTTWADKGVRAWLAEKTVSIKIDAEKEIDLAQKYRIDAFPTTLLLKPDGTEIDRLLGFRQPADFLEEAAAALAGRDSVTRAREKLERAEAANPMARMDYARALAQKGSYEEALDEYLWCFDPGAERDPGFVGVRVSFLLSAITDLARAYPAALDALRQRRDPAEKAVLAGTADREPVVIFLAINHYLGEDGRTLSAYDALAKMGDRGLPARRSLFDSVVDSLLEAKRYEDVAAGSGELSKRVDEQLQDFRDHYASQSDAEIMELGKQFAVSRSVRYYETLVGLGQLEQASAVADKLIAFDDSGETYASLIRSARHAGKADVAKSLAARALGKLPESERALVREAAKELE
jgi:thiol-disulfide isomerase/thioredoxin